MTDIVVRLRRDSRWTEGLTDQQIEAMCNEAADEIERLREALREIAEHADLYGPPDQGDAIALIHVARRALENQ